MISVSLPIKDVIKFHDDSCNRFIVILLKKTKLQRINKVKNIGGQKQMLFLWKSKQCMLKILLYMSQTHVEFDCKQARDCNVH